jgi:hypothetical protein
MHPVILAAAMAFTAIPWPYHGVENIPKNVTVHTDAFALTIAAKTPITQDGGDLRVVFTPPAKATLCKVYMDLGDQDSHDLSDLIRPSNGGRVVVTTSLPGINEMRENGDDDNEWRLYATCTDKEQDDLWFSQMYRAPLPPKVVST